MLSLERVRKLAGFPRRQNRYYRYEEHRCIWTGYTNQTFTISDISFTANNFIPNTGQVRGSGSSVTDNFYINNTAFNGKIKTVTMTMTTNSSSQNYFRNNCYCATGASAITTPAGAGTAGTISPDRMTITWTLNSNDSYFMISSKEQFTFGNVTNVVITVECE